MLGARRYAVRDITRGSHCVAQHARAFIGAWTNHLQWSAQKFEDNCTIWLVRLIAFVCMCGSENKWHSYLDYHYCENLTIQARIQLLHSVFNFCYMFFITPDRLLWLSSKGLRELVPRIYFCRDRPSSRYQEDAFPQDADEPFEKRWRSERRGGPPL